MRSIQALFLLLVVFMIRFGMGYYLAISGPTLFYLSNLVDVQVRQFSSIFSGRFGGCLVGGLLVSLVYRWTQGKINPLSFSGPVFGTKYLARVITNMGAGTYRGFANRCLENDQSKLNLLVLIVAAFFLLLKGVTNFFVPWITNYELMFVIIAVGGITFGYLDVGLQALVLRLWGATASRPLIYIYHFSIGIGGLVAPIIAKPFLVEAYGEQESNSIDCLGHNHTDNASGNASLITSTAFNPVGWTYILIGIFFFVLAAIVAVMARTNFNGKVASNYSLENVGAVVESRKEEPLRDVIWIFLPLIGYYFCHVSNEVLFSNFIFSVSVCSDLNFTISEASVINSVHWVGFFFGRGLGIFAASFTKPRYIATFSICGTITMMIIMIIFGQSAKWISWLVSCAHGFFVGPLYPSGVTWASKVTNVSGKYMFLFIIGGMVGCIVILPIGGLLFQKSPFSVMYLAAALSCINAVFFILAVFAARRHKSMHTSEKSDSEERQSLQEMKSNEF